MYSTESNHLILQYLTNETNKYPFIYSIPSNDSIYEIGFSLRDKFIIWSVEGKDNFSLYLVNMSINFDANNNPIPNKPKILLKEKQRFQFTFDWIHNLLYQIYKNEIFVSNIYKTEERVLIYSTESVINCAVINPINSLLFWTEMLTENEITNSSIFSANQDGSQPKLLISQNSIGFVGLTIDIKNEILFFYDVSHYSIFSIAFNGNDLKEIYKFSRKLIIQIENFDICK